MAATPTMDERPLRTLHVMTRHLGTGGSERDVEALTRWEAEQGDDVHLAAGTLVAAGSLIAPAVTLHHVPELVRSVSPPRDVAGILALRRLIRSGDFDVIHTHQSKAGVLGRLAARGTGLTVAHTVHMASFGPGYGHLASAMYLTAERCCAPITDVFVSVGEDLRDTYVDAGIGSRDSYLVARSAVDLDRFLSQRALTRADRQAVRAEVGVPGDRPLLVAAGLLEPRKRYGVMLAALAGVLPELDAHLVIAGEGPERPRLELMVERLGLLGRVHLPGLVTRFERLLGSADLLVHTSRAEGLSLTMVQALAAGLGIVATEVDGAHELARRAPRCVTLVPRDARGLGEACRRALVRPDREPLDERRLAPWTRTAVEGDFAALRRRIRSHRAGLAGTGAQRSVPPRERTVRDAEAVRHG